MPNCVHLFSIPHSNKFATQQSRSPTWTDYQMYSLFALLRVLSRCAIVELKVGLFLPFVHTFTFVNSDERPEGGVD